MQYNARMKSATSSEALINHISRLEGQLASVKQELAKRNPDCLKASATLHAASRSFASLRESFIECFLAKHFVSPRSRTARESEYLSLLKIINN